MCENNFNVYTRCNNGEFLNALNVEIDLYFLFFWFTKHIVCLYM